MRGLEQAIGRGEEGSPCTSSIQAYIVGPEVWVVLLNAIIQDRDHDAPA